MMIDGGVVYGIDVVIFLSGRSGGISQQAEMIVVS